MALPNRALVTGCAGFIGSHLTDYLINNGVEVVGLDNLSTGNKENMECFFYSPKFTFVDSDIREYYSCVMASEGVDAIFHQAALCSVPESLEAPTKYHDMNVTGAFNIFEAARINHVKRVVFASSAAVYGKTYGNIAPEGAEGNVLSPYAMSKKINELYAIMYNQIYNVPCIGLRYFNVYGPRQKVDSAYASVIPIFIKTLLGGGQCTIYGDGEQTRDFIYVSDVVTANVMACQARIFSDYQIFNIATGKGSTVNTVYQDVCHALKIDRNPIYEPKRDGDLLHSVAFIDNAALYLGYTPSVGLDEGIYETVEWYKNK